MLGRLKGQLQKVTQAKDVDINVQLRALKESKVKVTFRDIWRDYRMYHKSYFYYQVYEPSKESNKRDEVPVEVDRFSFKEYSRWLMLHAPNLSFNEPSHVLSKLIQVTLIFGMCWFIQIPVRAYYDYKDPLLKDDGDTLQGVSAEATLRRLKYKKKTPDWQTI